MPITIGDALLKLGANTKDLDAALSKVDQSIQQAAAKWKKSLKADTIVLAVGMTPIEDGLTAALEGKVPELYRIGDCVKTGRVIDAIWTGFRLARFI